MTAVLRLDQADTDTPWLLGPRGHQLLAAEMQALDPAASALLCGAADLVRSFAPLVHG